MRQPLTSTTRFAHRISGTSASARSVPEETPVAFSYGGTTHAVMMVIQHSLKVIAFGFIGVALMPWLPMVAAMIVSGFIGTVMGTRLLEKMPEALFQTFLKVLLTLIALDLLRRAAGIKIPGL